jgi:hypothetical protein
MAILHSFWENMTFIFSKHGKISNFFKESEATVLHFSLERQIKIELSTFENNVWQNDLKMLKIWQNKAFYGIFPNFAKILQNSMAPWQYGI